MEKMALRWTAGGTVTTIRRDEGDVLEDMSSWQTIFVAADFYHV